MIPSREYGTRLAPGDIDDERVEMMFGWGTAPTSHLESRPRKPTFSWSRALGVDMAVISDAIEKLCTKQIEPNLH